MADRSGWKYWFRTRIRTPGGYSLDASRCGSRGAVVVASCTAWHTPGVLHERTLPGLHDFLADRVLPSFAAPPGRCIDLGAGTGAFALRLQSRGWDVTAVERDTAGFEAGLPVEAADLDEEDLSARFGTFDLVVSVEVIEHMERPTGFLRQVGRLLTSGGVAIVTTPNVDNVVARIKFLLTDRIRMMDRNGDPTHISPIFIDLLPRYLELADLQLSAHLTFPDGFSASRRWVQGPAKLLSRILPGCANLGDNHVFVLVGSAHPLHQRRG